VNPDALLMMWADENRKVLDQSDRGMWSSSPTRIADPLTISDWRPVEINAVALFGRAKAKARVQLTKS
jgi:hypothetical protein